MAYSRVYTTHPKDIRNIITYIYLHNDELISVRTLVDQLYPDKQRTGLNDIGYCMLKKMIIYEENIYEKTETSEIVSFFNDVIYGTDYTIPLKKLYDQNYLIRLRITIKGMDYINNYKKCLVKFYSAPIILILVIILTAIIYDLFF